MNILIDIDGVIADFDAQMASELLARSKGIKLKENPDGYNMMDWFDDPFDEAGTIFSQALASPQFWISIPIIWDSVLWLNENSYKDNIYLCTKPDFTPGCLYGKQEWILKMLEDYSDKVIYVKDKSMLANKETTLIDDCPENIDNFIANGGQGILFTKPYNKNEKGYKRINNLDEYFKKIAT